MTEPVNLRTNAKVNLLLRVMGRRNDGWHDIETIFQSVSLSDDMAITPTNSASVDVHMDFGPGLSGELPGTSTNLAYRAARRLIHEGAEGGGARIEVTKNIPIGAGLGGGSANAAGVLVGLNDLWNLRLPGDSLRALAADLGSDVPFCIEGGSALGTGRGEKLQEIVNRCELWFVLGMSFEQLSTARVYAYWDEFGSSDDVDTAAMLEALEAGDGATVASLVHNDLEPAASSLRPELADKKARMLEAGALGACLSGSGPTVFGVAADEIQAGKIASAVADFFDRVSVAGSRPRCVERL